MSFVDLARRVFHRLPSPARDAIRLAAHPEREGRYRADWSELRRDFAPIADVLSRETRAGAEVLIHSTHGFIPSLKEEVVFGAMLRASGYRPVFLISRHGGLERYVRLVPGARIVTREDLALPVTPDDERIARDIVNGARRLGDLVAAEWSGNAIGRHALSGFMRARHLGSIDLGSHREALAAHVASSIAAARTSAAILERESATTILMNERGYTPYGEFFDAALARGRRVVEWVASHRDDARVFKAHATATRTDHPYSLSSDTWADALDMPFSEADRDRLVAHMEEFYARRTWFNFKRMQHLTRQLAPRDVIADVGLDPSKPTAVVFAHIFWDATFFYGHDLYEDYREWFVETVRLANRSTNVNWVVKLHPVNVWRLAADGVPDETFAELVALDEAGVRPAPHVKILMPDTHVSSWSLFQVADYCFTVRGMVGVEMSALGKRVITAGTGHYAGHGFTVDPSSREGYEAVVLDPTRVPAMTADECDRALRFAYCLLRRKPFQFDTYRCEYSDAPDVYHPLNGRVRFLSSGDGFVQSTQGASWASWLVGSTAEDCLMPGEHHP